MGGMRLLPLALELPALPRPTPAPALAPELAPEPTPTPDAAPETGRAALLSLQLLVSLTQPDRRSRGAALVFIAAALRAAPPARLVVCGVLVWEGKLRQLTVL